MERLELNNEQRKCLTDELAKLVHEYQSDNSVECIYFGVYDFLGRKELFDDPWCTLQVTVVRNKNVEKDSSLDDDSSMPKFNKLYNSKEAVKKYGVFIHVSYGYDTQYSIEKENDYMNTLFNSIIIFDRTGKYNQIKENAEEKYRSGNDENIYYYENAVQIEPPLEYPYKEKNLNKK